jgi:predicted ArsR family transcriptional regulator
MKCMPTTDIELLSFISPNAKNEDLAQRLGVSVRQVRRRLADLKARGLVHSKVATCKVGGRYYTKRTLLKEID